MVQIPLKTVGAAVAPAAVQGPNHRLQATANSLRSFFAPALGGA